jgi:hypothetical protein
MLGYEEQTAIATVLSDMDAELTAMERHRDKTRALKQGMMQELLTGKTRLISPKVSHARTTSIRAPHAEPGYRRLFQNTSFRNYCGIITSYEPNHNAISREPLNSDERYKFDTYTLHVLKNGKTTKQYEDETKRRVTTPARSKCLTATQAIFEVVKNQPSY